MNNFLYIFQDKLLCQGALHIKNSNQEFLLKFK